MNRNYTAPRIVKSCVAARAIMMVGIPKDAQNSDSGKTGTSPGYQADE
jgi:hypothetical protein